MAVGDRVLYNDGDASVDSWTAGVIVATHTSNPGAYSHFGGGSGNYPAIPASGQVLIVYAGMVGYSLPTWATAVASAGTGPGEYQTLLL